MKQKQRMNEETFQSEPRTHEQVHSHDVDSLSEEEMPRMARGEPRFQERANDFEVEFPEFEDKLDPEEFINWLHTVERVFECKDIPNDRKVKLWP